MQIEIAQPTTASRGSRVCKVEGCDRPAAASKGRYANLCNEHIAQKRASTNGHPADLEGERWR